MDRHETRYGIFLSNKSNKIKKKRFEIENDNKFLIYRANTGFEKLNVIYPILFIREMHKLNMTENSSTSFGLEAKYKDIYQSIVDSASNFSTIIDSLNELKQDGLESISSANSQLDKLKIIIMKNDLKIRNIVSNISNSINNKLEEIVETENLKNTILNTNDLSNIIETCLSKKNTVTMEFEQIINQFIENATYFKNRW